MGRREDLTTETAKPDLADAWDEGAEAINEWIAANPGPSGIWSDPPRNPYEKR
jgi:hypothetical protein